MLQEGRGRRGPAPVVRLHLDVRHVRRDAAVDDISRDYTAFVDVHFSRFFDLALVFDLLDAAKPGRHAAAVPISVTGVAA